MFGKSVFQIGARVAAKEREDKRRIASGDARLVLAACSVPVGADFHALRSEQVAALLSWADRRKYRAPRNANGSRARCYHAMLQRRAARS